MNPLNTTEMNQTVGGTSLERIPQIAPSTSILQVLDTIAQQQLQASLRWIQNLSLGPGAASPRMSYMNTTTEESERKNDSVLVSSAVSASVVGGMISSPLTGAIAGVTVATILLALRKRRPAISEVAMVLGVVIGTVSLVVLVDQWSDFKEGMIDGFNHFRRS